jgi:CRISPR/Cas system-associated exonuclease Cas4 (RecB family)
MRLIRASEIGEYVFCRRAWWLRAVQGNASVNVREMAAGTEAHTRHGQSVGLARGLQWLAFVLAALALIFLFFNR